MEQFFLKKRVQKEHAYGSYTFKCLPYTTFVFLRARDAEDEAVVFEDGF